VVPFTVPLITTVTPGIPFWSSSEVTWPVMVTDCAETRWLNNVKTSKISPLTRIMPFEFDHPEFNGTKDIKKLHLTSFSLLIWGKFVNIFIKDGVKPIF
jgi:hypothetical protein